MCNRRSADRVCHSCKGRNVAREPTPFPDEDGPRVIIVYRCRDCGAIDVPGYPVDRLAGAQAPATCIN